MNRLIRLGLRNGWRKGVQQGSRAWMVAGGVALAARVIQKAVKRGEPVVVYSERLEPGETLVIAHQPPS